MQFSIKDIVEITDGSLFQAADNEQTISFICTDSRRISQTAQTIFIALQTNSRDGHSYIQDAYDAGVRSFLVSHTEGLNSLKEACIIQVNDTLLALQHIAAAQRRKYDIPVFGITGSNGKTIVKEWLAFLFSKEEEVAKNPKSYNSQLGVPLSVSAMKENHTIGFFEAGISQEGEMVHLEKVIKPTTGIFTTIGAAHDANFSNQQIKIREKLDLFVNSKKLYYCKDHDAINEEVESFLLDKNPTIQLVTWGKNEKSDLVIRMINRNEIDSVIQANFKGEDIKILLPYTDSARIENAIHCWLVLLDNGYSNEIIAPWFLNLPAIKMRLELLKGINDCTIVNDTYSSDLASLRIALDFLYEQKQHNKYSLILSDILQHGKSNEVYKEVANLLCRRPLSKLVLIGDEILNHIDLFEKCAAEGVSYFNSVSEFLKSASITRFQSEAILIKGARKFMLERVVNRLEANIHRTVMNINLSALVNNVNAFRKRLEPETKIMAMVKAFSYGAGSYEIAHTLEHHGIDYLAVAYVDEGVRLRKKGIDLPILILNPEISSLDAMIRYYLEPEVYSTALLEQFAERMADYNTKLRIHIKLDTGMHRLGVEEKNLDQFINKLNAYDCFEVKSVLSHLVGSADEQLASFTNIQKEMFVNMSNRLEESLGYKVIKHLANTGGAIHSKELQFDMVRLGIGLYGISDDEEMQNELQQISTLKTNISQIKKVPKGETVGYSRAGKIENDSTIATLNIGYADGYSRGFSLGIGKVLVGGQLAPVVGNVCMDMIMVDITDIEHVLEGDEVIIFGEELPVTLLAEWLGTIPYEIVAGISQRVKRIFYRE